MIFSHWSTGVNHPGSRNRWPGPRELQPTQLSVRIRVAATGDQGPLGTGRRGRAFVTGWPRPVAWAWRANPTRSSFRIRVAASGGVGPEVPYHSDLTGPGHPVAVPPAVPGRPGQWHGPSGAPADMTRLPLRTVLGRMKERHSTLGATPTRWVKNR